MVSETEFRQVAQRLRNWGRWGPDDQLGTWNFVGPEQVQHAIAGVHTGEQFALGSPIGADGIWGGNSYRRNAVHLMSVDGGDSSHLLDHVMGPDFEHSLGKSSWGKGLMHFNDDYVVMPLQCASQWDALSHCYYDEQMYNGFPASAVTSAGATKLSIDVIAQRGVTGRAVLIDVARHLGVDHLDANYRISPELLDDVVATQEVELRAGDVVMIRTGWWNARPNISDVEWRSNAPGLEWTCAEWLYGHQVAAVAADNLAVEIVDFGPEIPEVVLPLHLLCLVEMGMMLGELWWLEALAEACAKDRRYDALLSANPLEVAGAVGSPVNPLVIR